MNQKIARKSIRIDSSDSIRHLDIYWQLCHCSQQARTDWCVLKLWKADIALPGESNPTHAPQSHGTSLAISYGITQIYTCHPTQVNAPRLNTSHASCSTRFTYTPEGWKAELTYIGDLIAPRPEVESATFWSRVRQPLRHQDNQYDKWWLRCYTSNNARSCQMR